MNTHLLNGGQIGNGAPVANKFWTAAVEVAVSTIAAFQVLTGISGQMNVTAVANFTMYVGMMASQNVTVVSTAGFSRFMQMRASITVSANSTCTMLVGRVRQLVSSVLLICQTVVRFYRYRQAAGHTSPTVSAVANFGISRQMQATCPVTVTTTSNFSNWGEYATNDRTVLVPEEDRRIEVT